MTGRFLVLAAVLLLLVNSVYAAGEVNNKLSASLKDTATDMEFVFVKGKCYQMGNVFPEGMPVEKPLHEVCLDNFYLGKYEVTRGQWKKIMGTNPSSNSKCDDTCAVENVSWNDAQEFIKKLNGKSGDGKYRLPTEAEWEFAARSGGGNEMFSGGNVASDLAWYYVFDGEADYRFGARPVGKKRPNGLGIFDMSGNVWEWTGDWYASDFYASSPKDNPTGPATGDRRVLRGGSWRNRVFEQRATYRNYLPPDYSSDSIGFRLMRKI